MRVLLWCVAMLGFVFWGCGNDDKIFSITQGEISTDAKLRVEFNEGFYKGVSDTLFVTEGAFKVNGKDAAWQYGFSNSTTLVIIPKELAPNTSYDIAIDFAKIAKDRGFEPPLKTIKMQVKTKPTEFFLSDLGVRQQGSESRLVANLELSQFVPMEILKKALSLKLDSKNITLSLTQSNPSDYLITSEPITPSNTQDLHYILTLDSKLLGADGETKERTIILPKNTDLYAMRIESTEESAQPNVIVHFSQELAKTPDLKSYIQVTPNVHFTASQSGSVIVLSGKFDFATNYNIKVLEGLKSINGASLKQDASFDITAREIAPSIAFASSGVFVPRAANKKIAFKSVNVKKVVLKLYRIYPNNLTQFLYDNNLIGDSQSNSAQVRECKNSYDEEYEEYYEYCSSGLDLERIGDRVLEREFSIDSLKNQWIQNELDFEGLRDLSGVFVVSLEFGKDNVDYDFGDMSEWRVDNFFRKYGVIAKHLIFSNTALLGQNLDRQFVITALDIAKNTPIAGVQISAINKKNQVVETKTTNANGDAIFSKVDTQNTLYFLTQNTSDLAVLKLGSSLVGTDGFDTQGVVSEGGMRAFVYADRGVHRPGDTIYLDAIVRYNDKPLDSAHPVLLTLKTPRGKAFVDKRMMESRGEGFYHYEIKTPKNADTGVWEAILHIGDSVFRKELSIESVAPNRLKVDLQVPDSLDLRQDSQMDFTLQSAYLFGAPASELEYGVVANFKPLEFKSKRFSDYVFGVPSSLHFSHSDSVSGTLNESGVGSGSIGLDSLQGVKSNLEALLIAKVYESNGRVVATRKKIPIKLFDSFVGIKPLANRYIETGTKVSLPVVVVSSEDSTLIKGRKVSYTIYHNQHSWWWDYDSYAQYLRSIKTDRNTKILAQGSLISSDKPVVFEYEAKQSGEVYVEFVDEESGALSGTSFYTSGWGEPLSAQKITALKIESDKARYGVGESANVRFESTAQGKALVVVSKAHKVLKRFWVETKPNQTSLAIPITEDMSPNVYVSVVFLQNYESVSNDRLMRLYGVIPLMVDKRDSRLDYEISAPERVTPGSEFAISLSTKQGIESTYTIALVDEGLLNLTDFATPNPWQYFYAKLALGLRIYDSYDLIVGRSLGKVQKILKIGGDGVDLQSYSKQKGDENANRFKPVVLYNAPSKTDEKGNVRLRFTMPTYIGSVRVMVVGASGKLYGSSSKNIQVSAPVVMLPTIPRALKVGDRFQIPIEVFVTKATDSKESVKNATISISSAKGIVKFKQDSQNIVFDGNKPRNIVFEAEVQNEVGVETITLSAHSAQGVMTDSIEIDIKAINPFISSQSSHYLKSDEELHIVAPQDFVKGTNKGTITISSNPLLNINHRVRWLVHYPYGCIEQTTSSVLPQLYLEAFGTFKDIDKKEIVENINAGIARIGGFVTPSGGFAYWQGGAQPSEWGSHYAGHFLVLAKKLGYYVPDSVYRGWLAYEKNFVKSSRDASYKAYPLFLLALANEPEIVVMNALYESGMRGLSNTDKWLLGAAYKMAGYEEIAKNITRDLSVKVNASKEYYAYSYGSPLRDEAMILDSYKIIYGGAHDALFDSIKAALESSKWLSTQDSGYALLSLANTQNAQEEGKLKGVIKRNGKKESFSESTQSVSFSLNQGEAFIESKTPLYVAYAWEGIPMGESIKPSSRGLEIKREFYDEFGNALDVSELKSASSFWIVLRVGNTSGIGGISNIALTQALPSGWEIENLRLNHDELPEFIRTKQGREVSYTDIRDDKIMWFFDMPYGNSTQVVFAKINAITPGDYTLPAAYAEAMYDNSFQAATRSQSVRVLAK